MGYWSVQSIQLRIISLSHGIEVVVLHTLVIGFQMRPRRRPICLYDLHGHHDTLDHTHPHLGGHVDLEKCSQTGDISKQVT
jgi:hypothetical protein